MARRRATQLAISGALFLIVVAIGLGVVRPFEIAPIGPDAAAPVIEFQRILAGQQLEGYLSQTSKPLLTVIYGVAYQATGGWLLISLLAILSLALCVVLASWLALRLGGPLAAGFSAAALALFPPLLIDVLYAYGVSWAMLACAVAGLAVTASRPRWAVAGIALAFGALARPEVLAITAVALGSVVGAQVVARRVRSAGPPASAWLLALGLSAIPVLAVHDWAIKGDPWFWLNTAQDNSAGQPGLQALIEVLRLVGRHELALAPLLPLAVIAVLAAAADRRWTAMVVVAILPLSVALFFIASGARGTTISDRYLLPVDIGIIWGAGIGLGAVVVPAVRRWFRTSIPQGLRRWSSTLGVAIGIAVALAMVPVWPVAHAAEVKAAHQRQRVAHAAHAFSVIAAALGPVPSWRGVGPPPHAEPLVILPKMVRAKGIVDLDLPLWAGAKDSHEVVDPAAGLPAPGTIIYHSRGDSETGKRWRRFEIDQPATVGRLRLIPLYASPEDGEWVLRVEDATRPRAGS